MRRGRQWGWCVVALTATSVGCATARPSAAPSPSTSVLVSPRTIRTPAPAGQILRGHTESVFRIVFAPDGRTLFTGSRDGTVRIWDPGRGSPVDVFPADGSLIDFELNPDGHELAIVHSTGTRQYLQKWSVADHKPIGAPVPISSPVLAVNRDATILAGTASGTVDIDLVDATTGRPFDDRRRISDGGGVETMAFSPVGRTLANAGDYGDVMIWGGTDFTLDATLNGTSGSIFDLAFSPDGRMLAFAGQNGVEVWDVRHRRRLGDPISGTPEGLAFSPDGKVLAFNDGGGVGLVNLASGNHTCDNWIVGEIRELAYSPDGNVLAVGFGDGTVELWHLSSLCRP